MPIKWSALKVIESMDEVEHQIVLAEQFLDQAKLLAGQSIGIASLPDYMKQRIRRVACTIDRTSEIREAIASVRNTIPDGAVEDEQEAGRHGSQQQLV